MRNIYKSYSWFCHEGYEGKLEEFIGEEDGEFELRFLEKEEPVNGLEDEGELMGAIEGRMKACDCQVVLVGVYNSCSRWLNKEIYLAQRMGVPIVAVEPWSAHRSSVVGNAADVIVRCEGKEGDGGGEESLSVIYGDTDWIGAHPFDLMENQCSKNGNNAAVDSLIECTGQIQMFIIQSGENRW